MARMAVVLPAPFGPSSTVMAPSGTSKAQVPQRAVGAESVPDSRQLHHGSRCRRRSGGDRAVAVGGTTATSDPNAGTGVAPVGTDGTAEVRRVGSGPWYGGGTSAVGRERSLRGGARRAAGIRGTPSLVVSARPPRSVARHAVAVVETWGATGPNRHPAVLVTRPRGSPCSRSQLLRSNLCSYSVWIPGCRGAATACCRIGDGAPRAAALGVMRTGPRHGRPQAARRAPR